ncbi:MAG TPA: hypothetical protein VHF51_06620 [Solirubrobacteraceae bacterium]|nr:hypothetical protein [Solirubrobacteraceae bacterium]
MTASLQLLERAVDYQGLDPIPDEKMGHVPAKCPLCRHRTPDVMSPLTVTAGAARVECLNGRDTQRVREAIPALHAGPTHRQGLAGVSRPERLRNPDPSRAKPIRWA